jgi:acetylornithine deacetylase
MDQAGSIRVRDALEEGRDEFVQALAQLVSTPSVNPVYDPAGGEAAAQQALAGILANWGMASEQWVPVPADLAGFSDEAVVRSRSFVGRPNLLARLGNDRGGRSLILNSHIDVVGITAGDQWTTNPFEAVIKDGWLHGRGATDAKGCLMAMASAMAIVRELGVPLRGSVTLHSVVDEEAGGGGTLAFIGRGGPDGKPFTADAAVVGEPTKLAICPATRGSRRFKVTVAGRSAHPGEAFAGVNAIKKSQILIRAIDELAARLDRERPHPLWQSFPEQHVFNLASIQGGRFEGAGSVPDSCTIEWAAGGTAAETLAELQANVEAAIAEAAASDPWLREHPPELVWNPRSLHPSETDAAHPFVAACGRAWESATGHRPTIAALSGVTDMRHLVRYAGIPTVTFGPGSLSVAHGADERIEIDEYLTAIRMLALLILDWCA